MGPPTQHTSSTAKMVKRYIYVENVSGISSNTIFFTYDGDSMDDIVKIFHETLPYRKGITYDFCDRKFGMCNRNVITDPILPPHQDCIYVRVRIPYVPDINSPANIDRE